MPENTENSTIEAPSNVVQSDVKTPTEQATLTIKPDELERLVSERIAKATAEYVSNVEAKRAAKDKVGKSKLSDDPDLVALLPDTSDEFQLNAVADKLRAAIKKHKPDFGGAQREGGNVPAENKVNLQFQDAASLIASGLRRH